MNKDDLTILLTSCDAYKDAWEPFFVLWYHFWPKCEYPFVLNSETQIFQSDTFAVKTICGGKNLTWSKRLKNCLKAIETEYVLLCLEDYFLQAPVNTEIFQAALDTMNEDKDIGVIQFAIDIHAKYDETVLVNQYFSPVPKYKKDNFNGRIYCVLSLYRTAYLKKLLLVSESPWEFELFGSIRSQFFHEKVYRENESHLRCFQYYIEPKYGYAISRGKWLPKNAELFSKYHIQVDFSNLGMIDGAEYQELVEQYNGNRKKNTREHSSLSQKLMMMVRNPQQFLLVVKTYVRKRNNMLKTKMKFRFPFLP